MQICDYIKSKAMRKHLKNYKFNALEAAWIVLKSDVTMNKQNEALQQIIDTMPDYIPDYITDCGESVHQLISEYIKERVRLFLELTDKNDKYIYSSYIKDGPGFSENYFDSFAKCYNKTLESVDWEQEYIEIKAHKKDSYEYYWLSFSLDGEIIRITDTWGNDKLKESVLTSPDIKFPHPFKAGDIVSLNSESWPMVIAPEKEKQYYGNSNNGLSEFVGAYTWENGKIAYDDVPCFFLDYYNDELEGKDVIFNKLKNYLQREHGLDELLNDYVFVLLDSAVSEFG